MIPAPGADDSGRFLDTGVAVWDGKHYGAITPATGAPMPPITLLADNAGDLMSPNPVSIESTATVAEAVTFLTDRGVGSVVVIDEAGRPLGVVTKTDLLVYVRERGPGGAGDTTPVREVMTPAVFSVRVDTPAQSVIAQFLALNVHHLFVTDTSGILVGVISPVDVLRKLG